MQWLLLVVATLDFCANGVRLYFLRRTMTTVYIGQQQNIHEHSTGI